MDGIKWNRFADYMEVTDFRLGLGAASMANEPVILTGSRMRTSKADIEQVIDDALNFFETVLKEC